MLLWLPSRRRCRKLPRLRLSNRRAIWFPAAFRPFFTGCHRLVPQTVTEPTVRALRVQTVTPAAASKSNVVLLAGAAAAGLCFAGGVFHFTRRVHRSARTHLVADASSSQDRDTARRSARAAASLFFEVVGPTAPWAKTAGQSARPQAHASIENFPAPNHLYSIVFCHRGGPCVVAA
jgi:hypothetical protein